MTKVALSAILRQTAPTFQGVLHGVNLTEHTTLPNRFRVVTQKRPGSTCTIGVWIDAGSRWETEKNNGTAHFLEHLNFKGTGKRSKYDVEYGMEKMGAHLNAYTSREQTCYYIKCMRKDTAEAVDILSDILLNSKRTEINIQSETDTILQEKKEVEARIEEVLMDHLHSASFGTNGLGLSILGTEENIKNVNKKMVEDFINTHYVGRNMVLVGCGAVEQAELCDLGAKYFGGLPEGFERKSSDFSHFTGGVKLEENQYLPNSHISVAFKAPGASDKESYYHFRLLEQLLGSYSRDKGDSAYSCFTRAVVKEFRDPLDTHRISRINPHNVHSIQTFYTTYVDVGLFGFYVVAESGEEHSDQISKIVQFAMRQLLRITQFISDEEFERAKNQLKVQIMVQLDGTTNIADDIGRQVLHHGVREPLHVIFARIDAINKDALVKIANEYIYDKNLVLAAIGNINNIDYNAFRQFTKNRTFE